MADYILQKEYERVSKKHATVMASANKAIDDSLADLERIYAKLDGGADKSNEAMDVDNAQADTSGWQSEIMKLPSHLQSTQTYIQSQSKDYSIYLQKLLKSMEKNFNNDLSKVATHVALEQEKLKEVIAHHLIHEGRFRVAEAFAEEANIKLPQSALTLFQDMYNIVSSLQQHDLDPALEWELSNRSKLPQSMLGFHLRRMKFIQILCNEGQQAALSYIREHLSNLSTDHLPDLKRLMGCIVYAPDLNLSPYSDLVSADMWGDLQREFVRECTSILDHSSQSPLSVTLLAGCAAMPQMVKLASTLKASKGVEWSSLPQLPIEIEIGAEFQFYSIFSCPVSKDQATEENPAMHLPCGHVLCKKSLHSLPKPNAKVAKCPYCPEENSLDSCKQIYF